MAKVEIKSDGIKTQLIVDGVDISSITSSFSLEKTPGNVPILSVKIFGTEVSIDSVAYPKFPERVTEAIKSLAKNYSAVPAATEKAE